MSTNEALGPAVAQHSGARTFGDAMRAREMAKPLEKGDARWKDLAPGRGDDAAVELPRILARTEPAACLQLSFAGQRDVGKSTELNGLALDLRDRFRLVYREANHEQE